MNKQDVERWFDEKRFPIKTEAMANLITQCFADLQPQWVSVADRLPEVNECVDIWGHLSAGYCQGDEARICDAFYSYDNNYWWYYDDCQVFRVVKGFNVTHYKQRPLPPSEG